MTASRTGETPPVSASCSAPALGDMLDIADALADMLDIADALALDMAEALAEDIISSSIISSSDIAEAEALAPEASPPVEAPPSELTVTAAVIKGCISQKYVNVPGVSNVYS